VAELVHAYGLGPYGATLGGSSPPGRTQNGSSRFTPHYSSAGGLVRGLPGAHNLYGAHLFLYVVMNQYNSLVTRILRYPEVWFLVVAAFVTRFWQLWFPYWVMFDETHFGLYATKYLSHQYYFDVHPPLGKMILGVAAWIGGVDPGFSFQIGDYYPDFSYVALRFFPALFGALLVPLVYILVRQLGFSRRAAFLGGFCVLFENALLLQARFISLESILLLFIFLSFFLFLGWHYTFAGTRNWYYRGIAVVFALGAALSVKWVGFGALLVILTFIIIEHRLSKDRSERIVKKIIFLIAFPLFLYMALFSLHFSILSESCARDCGAILEDVRLGGASKTVYGIFNSLPQGNIAEKFLQTHVTTFAVMKGGVSHPAKTSSYALPFMRNFIELADQEEGGKRIVIFMRGNAIVWGLGLFGILGVLYLSARVYAKTKWRLYMQKTQVSGLRFLLIGYIVFFAVFAAIQHTLLLYHYFAALIFSILMFCVFFDWLLSRISGIQGKVLYGLVLFFIVIGFLVGMPYTYGIPIL
jgi:dolichyl-phosphate-mannose--protein O-mannosyl transferase